MIVSASFDSRKKRILAVEDDADSCELLEFILADYEIVFASGIDEALILFVNQDFQLCLLDNKLFDGIGTELCKEIRALNKSVPIVFASGVSSRNDIQKALDAGAQAYLVKPYFPEDLKKIVKELVEKNV